MSLIFLALWIIVIVGIYLVDRQRYISLVLILVPRGT